MSGDRVINFGEKAALYKLLGRQKRNWRNKIMLTMTTKQALMIADGINSISSFGLPKDKIKLGYKIALISAALEDTVTAFNTKRNALLAELGTPVEGQPGQFNLDGENLKKFQEADTEMLSTTIEIGIAEKIKLSELDGIEGIKPQWIKNLLPVLDATA